MPSLSRPDRDHRLVEHAQLAQRKSDIVKNRERRKQRPLLKKHTEAAAQRAATRRIGIENLLAEELDAPLARRQQTDNLAQQGRLAAARTADQTEHLPGFDVEIDVAMDHDIAELCAQAANLDRRQPATAVLSGKVAEHAH